MANPADPGTFDLWISDRLQFKTMPPKADDTGDFDRWITDRIHFSDYVAAAVAAAAASPIMISRTHPRNNILLRM